MSSGDANSKKQGSVIGPKSKEEIKQGNNMVKFVVSQGKKGHKVNKKKRESLLRFH